MGGEGKEEKQNSSKKLKLFDKGMTAGRVSGESPSSEEYPNARPVNADCEPSERTARTL